MDSKSMAGYILFSLSLFSRYRKHIRPHVTVFMSGNGLVEHRQDSIQKHCSHLHAVVVMQTRGALFGCKLV